MAKIAVELEAKPAVDGSTTESRMTSRTLAEGSGWRVTDVVCTAGPADRPFEERHACANVAIVVAGTFQYRGDAGVEFMTPGSILLGNAGQRFECGHEHGTGDRCVSFQYSAEYFGRLAEETGGRSRAGSRFRTMRVPPLRAFSSIVARAKAGLAGGSELAWEELGLQIAAKVFAVARGTSPSASPLPSALARVTRVVRRIENEADGALPLASLAEEAGLSPYHFLRSFQELTGLTPHQYVRRLRLRKAAERLASSTDKVLDVALDCGFGDVSNFNRAFRSEFGTNPNAYRLGVGR